MEYWTPGRAAEAATGFAQGPRIAVPGGTAANFSGGRMNLNKRLADAMAKIGGWYRVRTCDPCRVKAVLYR
jgi:hypothetical protein